MKAAMFLAALAATLGATLAVPALAQDSPTSGTKEAIKDDARTVGHAVADASRRVGNTIRDDSKKAGHAIAHGAEKAKAAVTPKGDESKPSS
jgi:predicted methyltransferase